MRKSINEAITQASDKVSNGSPIKLVEVSLLGFKCKNVRDPRQAINVQDRNRQL